MCKEKSVGSDNFQDRKIHRKGVFRPDPRRRSEQGSSPLDVVPRSRLNRPQWGQGSSPPDFVSRPCPNRPQFALAHTHTHAASVKSAIMRHPPEPFCRAAAP